MQGRLVSSSTAVAACGSDADAAASATDQGPKAPPRMACYARKEAYVRNRVMIHLHSEGGRESRSTVDAEDSERNVLQH